MVEVGPGVIVTGEEASFIFERLHWSKEGELESFKMRAPSTMKFDDIDFDVFRGGEFKINISENEITE